jgi:hypothetical protein
MSAGLQLGTQLWKVINFAVEYDPYGLVFVEYWLMPSSKIDNAEPPHPQSDASLYQDTFVVWPPMHDGLAHPVNGGAIHRAVRMGLDHSYYAAHALSSQHFCRPFGVLGIGQYWTPSLELIIPVLAGIPFLAITGG